MALSNLFAWNQKTETAVSTACGAGDEQKKPAACGSACGAGEK